MSALTATTLLGGHAIMLAVQMPQELQDIARDWCADGVNRTLPKLAGHVTVLFVGRDLPLSTGLFMRRVAEDLITETPPLLRTKGPFTMFGAKRDHFVALVESMVSLDVYRQKLIARLTDAGIKIGKMFAFNPHLTLAVGVENDTVPMTRLRQHSLLVESVEVKTGDNIHSIKIAHR